MKVKFLGAAGEVTGSSFLVNVEGKSFLVDFGMFQGENSEEKNFGDIGFDPKEVEAVILTHAHLDHCGRLPILAERGFGGKIWMTPPTADLAQLVLYDSAKIARGRFNESGDEALYKEEDVDAIIGRFATVDYNQRTVINENVSFAFLDAGHILGSASIQLWIKENGVERIVVFSGDLGNEPGPIVELIEDPESAEVVVMESTYGDRLHEPKGREMEDIAELCKEIERTGGTLLVPAFSLERSQELLNIFDQAKKAGLVSNDLQVYLDSPMAMRATAIYERYPHYFNETMRGYFAQDDPFDFPGLNIIRKIRQSDQISEDNGAKVIIAGSGMMSGGRIVKHARRWLGDNRTIVLFTGYQAKGTLGRSLYDGLREVEVDGLMLTVKAKVVKIETMSGHADQKQLLDWLAGIKQVKKVVLIHGEGLAREAMDVKIKEMGINDVVKPMRFEEIEI